MAMEVGVIGSVIERAGGAVAPDDVGVNATMRLGVIATMRLGVIATNEHFRGQP